MTKALSVFDPKTFDQFFVGFDHLLDRAFKVQDEIGKVIPNYPPYNVRKVDDNHYVIEMAVAGFDNQDIDITMEDDKLIIKGSVKTDVSDNGAADLFGGEYLFKGIGMRSFTRSFALSDYVEVKDAEMFNGMLRVMLERMIPEHKKPKKIEVKTKG